MAARDPAPAIAAGHWQGSSAALAQRLLNVTLFVTVLLSAVAFIEPSPHDVMMFILLVACVTARVPFDRKLTPLLVVTILWLVGGGLSLIQVGDDAKAIQYFGTSVYLGLAGLMFAALFSEGDPLRLLILRRAYILAAMLATVAGYIGFFHLLPHAELFLENERVSATFKDPNVYGPFLIYPLLLLMIGLLTRRVTITGIAMLVFMLGGLFLSFSRGAWFHFALSALIAIVTLYVASPDPRMRTRIVVFGFFAVFAAALVVVALTSISSVHDMLLLRAKAVQPYDIAPNGRFALQELALSVILDHPNGMGPAQFGIVYGGQQHNVYMQCFLVYGWLGGATYLVMVLLTFMIGFRNMLMPTPWQSFLITAYAAFVGETVEGMIVDTDHWRHFFLLMGLVWGLSIATINWRRCQGAIYQAPAATALALAR
jgi:hypothetical protein